jgi:carbamoyltransferase
MQRTLNLKIKFRESFRPFAPAVPEERVAEFFELKRPSPYMLLVAKVRRPGGAPRVAADGARGLARLQAIDSPLPAVTHVDDSARVQTVSRASNPRFHALLEAFGARTGVPVLVNTSFNVRGEPIVCTLADAWSCFMATGMDVLVLGRCLLRREAQPAAHPLAATPRHFEED